MNTKPVCHDRSADYYRNQVYTNLFVTVPTRLGQAMNLISLHGY